MSADAGLHAVAATGDRVSPHTFSGSGAGRYRNRLGGVPALRHDADRRHHGRWRELGLDRPIALSRSCLLRIARAVATARSTDLAGNAGMVAATPSHAGVFHGTE